jgi:hypothetical protein
MLLLVAWPVPVTLQCSPVRIVLTRSEKFFAPQPISSIRILTVAARRARFFL